MGVREHRDARRLQRIFETRDPFCILSGLGVRVLFSTEYKSLKGFCFVSNRIPYVVINATLPPEEQRVVAAHELGHLRLHRTQMQCAFMSEEVLSYRKDTTEREANTFAADLLLSDKEVEAQLKAEETMDLYTMAKRLRVMPELLAFKLHSMIQRGHKMPLPMGLQSNFLA